MISVCIAVLLAEFGSDSVALTVAVFFAEEGVTAVTTMLMVAEEPLLKLPSEQVTVPLDCEQLPWLGVAETKDTCDGSVSVTDTFVALLGPLLVTVSV